MESTVASLLRLSWEVPLRALTWLSPPGGDKAALAGPATLDPLAWALFGLEAALAVGDALVPAPAVAELRNKVRAFQRFHQADGEAAGSDTPLGRRLAAAGPAADFAALWRREGTAYAVARRWCLEGGEGAPWPHSPAFEPAVRIVAHTGLGLALAVGAVDEMDSDGAIEGAIDRFAIRCRSLPLPGYEAAALEGLGMAVRLLEPRLTSRVGARLESREPEMGDLFWHGVGRGLYFCPSNALPLAPFWRTMEQATVEPPRRQARANAVAGLAWAVTLVNLAQPELVAWRLATPAAGDDAAAIGCGVASALLLWRRAAGAGEPLLGAFLDYRPATERAEAWERRIVRPATEALSGEYPRLAADDRFDDLFRYRPGPWE
jgi:hypothetical protein